MHDAARLRRLRRAVLRGLPMEDDDRRVIAECIDQSLSHRQGRPDLVTRDARLRVAAARFWPGRNVSEQARFLRQALLRYHASGWQAEQYLPAPPPARAGTIEEVCWQVLNISTAVLSERQLRKKLALDAGKGQAERAA